MSNQAQSGDYFALSRQVKQSGLLERRYVYYRVKLGLVPILCGTCFLAFILIGSTRWRRNHARHHASPNRVGSDPDLAVPAITFTAP